MTDPFRERVVAAIGHQYEIEDEIGRGGMSVVYRARDPRLNRTVAIKVLPPELAYDPAVGSRFTREAQTSAQLSHPHIVPIYDVGERDGIAYFVMALITGGNLATRLEQQPLRPMDETRRLLGEIADALAYAHMRGVIHRDIKADNILIDGDRGRAMVTDFGIARAIESGSRLTQTGIAVGTPAYMSPEQAVGERDLDGRSDVYSLGVLGYQMITGRVPFTASNPMALLLKHVSERPRPILDVRPETPRALADAVERALKKAPEDRWPTAAAFRDALASGDTPASSWRGENREPVRYASPVPRSSKRDARAPAPRTDLAPVDQRAGLTFDRAQQPTAPVVAPRGSPSSIVLVPPHLASLTVEQRTDLRLWHGRIDLLDRVKATRRYAVLVTGMAVLSFAGFVFGVNEAPPFVLAPIVPLFMSAKLHRRMKSLRDAGLQMRKVFTARRSRFALPAPPPHPTERQLEKLAPREVLDSPRGAAVRRAAEDRAAILDIVSKLSKTDRALLPDIVPTIDGLVDRVAHLAQMLHRLDGDIDPHLVAELDERIARAAHDGVSIDAERRLALLRRQRASADELAQRRDALVRQLDSAGLALGNLRLDLIKLRASGVESTIGDVSSATQEARALSREIGRALEAAAELRDL